MTECGKPAVACYIWPTMDKLYCCEGHAQKAVGIASLLGFRLGVLDLVGTETCTQQVEEPKP